MGSRGFRAVDFFVEVWSFGLGFRGMGSSWCKPDLAASREDLRLLGDG